MLHHERRAKVVSKVTLLTRVQLFLTLVNELCVQSRCQSVSPFRRVCSRASSRVRISEALFCRACCPDTVRSNSSLRLSTTSQNPNISVSSSSVRDVCTREEGNMGLYIHRNHYGSLGTGKLGGRKFLYLTHTRSTITTRMILH